jgi:cell division protein FtsL
MTRLSRTATKPTTAPPLRGSGVLGLAVLTLMVFCSAIGVVYNKHLSRQLFTQLQAQQQEVDSLQVEWSQLLLEQGTWASDARVEKVAREHLQMVLPEPNEVVVITQ